jgi:radical SAM-linked protein
MAYSSGFSPHPRISYANASPTGAASEAEYLEIGLAQVCDAHQVRVALDAALPPGLDVVEVVVAAPGALADLLTASRWRIDVVGVKPNVTAAAVAAVLAQDSLVVQRMTKGGMRAFDVRQAIVTLHSERSSDPAPTGSESIGLVVRHQEPLVRPDDVLTAMAQVVPDFRPAEIPILTRVSQGTLDPVTAEIAEPFGQR